MNVLKIILSIILYHIFHQIFMEINNSTSINNIIINKKFVDIFI